MADWPKRYNCTGGTDDEDEEPGDVFYVRGSTHDSHRDG
jgi:hypothetical protein